MSATRIKVTGYVVSIAYSIALAASGLRLPGTASKLLSLLPIVIVAIFAAFDKRVWRFKPIAKLARRPVLHGTWRGELTSYRSDQQSEEIQHPPIPIAITISQTFTTISVTLMTAESTSRSVAEVIERRSSTDEWTLYYQYNNVPKLALRANSPIHAGSTSIQFSEILPSRVEGEYWTARRTRGVFSVDLVDRSLRGSFEAVMALPPPTADGV